MEVVVGSAAKALAEISSKTYCGVLVQYPDTYGVVSDWSEFVKTAHSHDTLVVACTDLLASVLLKPVGMI